MSDETTHDHVLEIPVIVPSGSHCTVCVDRLETAVGKLRGVEGVEVDRGSGTITVSHDPAELPEDLIQAEVERLGLEVGKGAAHDSWRIIGLD